MNLAEYNPRNLTTEEFDGLVESLKTFGLVEPIVVNKDFTVIGGHQRIRAWKHLGNEEIEVNVIDLDKKLEKALNVTLNNPHVQGTFDDLKLQELLNEIHTLENFEALRLDKLYSLDLSEVEEDEPDLSVSDEPKTKEGDYYDFNGHRIYCADSTRMKFSDLAVNVSMSFTSPPYNTDNRGFEDSKYESTNDDLSSEKYKDLLVKTTKLGYKTADYAFVNIQQLSGNKVELIEFLYELKDHFVDVIIWDKENSIPAIEPNVLNSRFEYIFIFSKQKNPTRKIDTGKFQGTVDNVYSAKRGERNEFSDMHRATFPLHLPAYFIQNFTKEKDYVLDLFLGTGTTLMACEKLDRKCIGVEIDPKYVDLIIRRWIKYRKENGLSTEIKRNGYDINIEEFE